MRKKVIAGNWKMNMLPNEAISGEVSGQMLKSIGVEYVIIGHSERRLLFRRDR